MTNIIKNQILLAFLGVLIAAVCVFFGLLTGVKAGAVFFVLYLIIKNVNHGLMFLVLAIPFISDENMLLLMGVVFLALCFKILEEGQLNKQEKTLQPILMLFIIMMIATTLTSVTFIGSQRDFILHGMSLALLFAIIYTDQNKIDLHKIYLGFILTGVICAIWGVQQYIVGVPMGSGWVDPALNPDVVTRVYAAFQNPNLFAMFLLLVLPITLSMVYTTKQWSGRLIFGCAWGLMLVSLVLTLSRGGYVAFFVSLVVFIFLTNPKHIIVLISIGVLSVPLLPPVIMNRILSIGNTADSSNYYRITLWRGASVILKDYWHMGTGLGYNSFRTISPRYFMGMDPYHLHNTYLQFFVETGILGIFILLLLIIAVLRIGMQVIGNVSDEYIKNVTAGLIAGFISLLIYGFFEHVLFNPKIIVYFWLTIGFILMNYKYYKKNRGLL